MLTTKAQRTAEWRSVAERQPKIFQVQHFPSEEIFVSMGRH